jgi:flagellar hook-associated protein 2
MATTVDGLVSGLDTTTIINQLIQIQAAPQTRLKSSLTSAQSEVTAFQAVNTKMSALQAAADKVSKLTTWGSATATSSSPDVSVTAASGALIGSVTFSVTQLAAARSTISTQTFSSLSASGAVTDSPIEIHAADGSLRASISPTGTSLADVVQAINSSKDAGVTAAAVQVSPGQYRLQLTATSSGTANDFSVTGSGGSALSSLTFSTVTAPRDAMLHVGDAASGYDVTSSSNTIEGLLPGLTVRVGALAADVTVSTAQDSTAITSAVQAMVDAMNAALSTIRSQTSTGTVGANGTRTGVGGLAGESSMRTLTANLMQAVTHGVGGASLSAWGITTTRDGSVTFNADAFGVALADDPAATRRVFTSTDAASTGFATNVAGLAKRTSSSTGTIAMSIQGRNTTITDLSARIADWDDRLAAGRLALQRQYSALETALGRMQSQATWLSGQISSLGSSQ